jgi:hypothetical protein
MDNGWQTYHIHCNECYRRRCSDAVGCDIVECVRGCGSLLHACKLEDHNLVCPRVKVACVNSAYGCPFVVERKFLGVHLIQCPVAVRCSRGWNRTPRHSKTQYPPFNKDLLDWSLALRDERQLQSQHHSARKPPFSSDDKSRPENFVMPLQKNTKEENEDVQMAKVIPSQGQFSSCGRAVEHELGRRGGYQCTVCVCVCVRRASQLRRN